MCPPAGRLQIHLDVADMRRAVANLNHSATEIRPTLDAGKTGMKHPHGFTVQRDKLVPPQPLVLPDRLHQAFGWRMAILAEHECRAVTESRLRIMISAGGLGDAGDRGHLALLLRRGFPKVKHGNGAQWEINLNKSDPVLTEAMTVAGKSGLGIALLLVAAALTGGCDRPSTPQTARPAGGDIRRDATVNAIEQTMPSVVSILTTALTEYRDPFLQWRYGNRAPVLETREGLSTIGSGVMIHESGYLLTSLHVVTNNTYRIQVKFANGDVYDVEPCVGTALKDIALLRIKEPQGKLFQAIKFADDDDLLLGESVIALGNPYGLGGSVSRGILSSKNRRPSSGDAQLEVPDWLQTDADINPGNSGGPLINLHGQMIGINARVYRESQGMGVGFAIPIKQINSALSDFFTPEAASQCWFGARVGPFNAPLVVTRVQARSPADLAGLEVGQRILRVNGTAPLSIVDFHRLAMGNKDSMVRLEVEAKNGRRLLNVQMVPFQDLLRKRLGLGLRPLLPAEAVRLNIRTSDAMVVDHVEANSPAAEERFETGFLVTAFDEMKINALLHAAEIVSTKLPGDRVKVAFAIPQPAGAGFSTFTCQIKVR